MTDYYVLHSGGLDSTTALALASTQEDVRDLYSVNIDYGQRHVRELDSAATTASNLGARRITIDLRAWAGHLSGALTDGETPVPSGEYDEETMSDTVVPGRNAVFITAAGAVAKSRSGDHPAVVVVATHGGDHHLYADCRPEFIAAQDRALRLGTEVGLWAPFAEVSKTGIVKEANRIGAPLADTWSCYEGGQLHCGVCGTCRERRDAFIGAGVPDPTEYAGGGREYV